MTIGEGIFWSTIVLVSFAAIFLLTKKKLWKKVLKGFVFVAGLAALIAGGFWLYDIYGNRPQVMSSLGGIRLGMSEVDVTLKKGKPDEKHELNKISDKYRKYLLYRYKRGANLYAIFDGKKDTMIVTVVCESVISGRVLGFKHYSLEKEIVDKLGPPSQLSINQDATRKILSYPKWNAAFETEKGKITEACVTSRSQIRYSVEYGDAEKFESSQHDINVEACADYRTADEQLNATYKEILKRYNDDPVFLEALKKAQRAWLAFRDAEMVARYPEEDKQYHYGSAYPMCSCAGIAYLTRERAYILREWLTAEEGDVCNGSRRW